jgi:hypothetical protein
MEEVKAAVGDIEKEMGKRFGDKANTLLFSVRSGAAVSVLVCVGWLRLGRPVAGCRLHLAASRTPPSEVPPPPPPPPPNHHHHPPCSSITHRCRCLA